MKIKVNQIKSCFVIRFLKDDEEKFFGGFYNEVENPGDDDECMCWENEDWFDSVEEALHFKTLEEAKSYFDVLQHRNGYYNGEHTIMLYGWNDIKNANDSNWYPLKDFIY